MKDKALIPEKGKTLIGMHKGNFAYIKEDEIRCVFESGTIKILKMPIKNTSPERILNSFHFNYKSATWIESNEKTV